MKYSKEAIMYVKRGEYYLNIGKFKEAEKDFNTALDKHPPAWDRFTAYSYYILITNERGEFKKTKQFLKEIDKLKPEIIARMRILTDMGEKGELGYGLLRVGNAYSELGDHQKSLEYYKLVLKLYPVAKYTSSILIDIGDSYYHLGDMKKAKKYTKDWLKTFKGNEKNLMYIENKSIAYKILEEYDKSIMYMTKAINMEKDKNMKLQRILDRSVLYNLKGDKKLALKDVNIVLREAPKHSRLYQQAIEIKKKIKKGIKVEF